MGNSFKLISIILNDEYFHKGMYLQSFELLCV